jgi:ketosteroid isomerase-like protein
MARTAPSSNVGTARTSQRAAEQTLQQEVGDDAPQEVFQRALRSVQDRDLDAYVELFADDGTLEFPFAPPGAPQRMQGRVEIRRSLGPLWQRARQSGRRVTGYDPVVVHNTTDPEVIVAEFTLHGVEDRGDSYRMSYVHVYRVRHGRILSLRDYWDPLALAARDEATRGG